MTNLKRFWWIVLLGLIAGLCYGYWVNSRKPPSYISTARMMVNGHISMPEGAVYSEELSNFYGTQAELMRSAEVKKRAAALMDSEHPDLKASDVKLNIGVQQGTSFFVLSAIGDDPRYTQYYLDTIMDEYVRYKRDVRTETSGNALTSITDELFKTQKQLNEGQEELFKFQKDHDVVFLEEEGNSAAKYLAQLDGQLSELDTEYRLMNLLDLDQNLDRDQQKLRAPDNASAPDGDAARAALGPELDYLKARQQVQLLQAEKERHARFMRPKHPIMKALDVQIAEQQRLISLFRDQSQAELDTRKHALAVQIDNLKNTIKDVQAKALDLTQSMSQFNRLKENVDRTKALYDRLLASDQSVNVNTNLQEDLVSVMEHASPATTTTLDAGKPYATGATAGIIAGLVIILGLVFLDDRIGSTVELEQQFSEQVLGQIPAEKINGRLNLIKLDNRHRLFAESYRNLRSALLFMAFEDARPKSYLITSAVPGEGKSTVAVNFAITMANAGTRTLLVDGDMRKGVLHEYFSSPVSPGLSSVLQGKIKWQEAVRDTPIENLFFLTRGKCLTGESESFISKATDTFLQEIYREYDCIVIDSAPVVANDDTTSLAPKIDAVLFVVRTRVTPANLARVAMDALYKRQVNILGIVLNSVNKNSAGYYYNQRYSDYYAPTATGEELAS